MPKKFRSPSAELEDLAKNYQLRFDRELDHKGESLVFMMEQFAVSLGANFTLEAEKLGYPNCSVTFTREGKRLSWKSQFTLPYKKTDE